jgi:hypothetical protein
MPNSVGALADQVATISDMIDEMVLNVASMPEPDRNIDPRERTDDRIRELLVGLEHVRNAAEAAQATAMVALSDEARDLDVAEFAATGLPSRSHCEFVADEISVLLACTKADAGRRYGLALRAASDPAVAGTWRGGAIDARKVQAITDELTALADPEVTRGLSAADVQDVAEQLAHAAVEHARTHTWSETRAWVRRRVVRIVPEVAELRRGRAEQERRVQITPADDGMSELWAWLPSVEARQIQQALSQSAQALGASDGRSMDQRRADLLVDWLLGPDHAPTVHLHVVVETPDGSGDSNGVADDVAAWLPGVGTLTELQTSDLLGSAQRVVNSVAGCLPAEPGYRPSGKLESAVRVRDVTCRFPGCRRAALGTETGTDLDHTVAWPAGATSADNLAVLCRRHHRLKHSPGWSVTLNRDATMTWTTPTGRTYISEPWHLTNRPGSVVARPNPPPLE